MDKFEQAWAALKPEFERGNIMALKDVQTGGGIWAILFDRYGPSRNGRAMAFAASTYAVFQDPDQEPGYVVTRHADEDAFWRCQDSGCPAIKVATTTQLVEATTLDQLPGECEGDA